MRGFLVFDRARSDDHVLGLVLCLIVCLLFYITLGSVRVLVLAGGFERFAGFMVVLESRRNRWTFRKGV